MFLDVSNLQSQAESTHPCPSLVIPGTTSALVPAPPSTPDRERFVLYTGPIQGINSGTAAIGKTLLLYALCCSAAALIADDDEEDEDDAAAVQLSHVPVLSSGSSRLSGCRRRRHWQYLHPPSTSSSGRSGHYRAQRPQKDARPRHHHLNPPPPPAHRHPTCAQRLVAKRKRDKNPRWASLATRLSFTNQLSLTWRLLLACPALGLHSGLFLRVSLSGRGPIPKAIALGSFSIFLLQFSTQFSLLASSARRLYWTDASIAGICCRIPRACLRTI